MAASKRGANGVAKEGEAGPATCKDTDEKEGPSLRSEWSSVLVLVVLYALQGVPLGLSMGSMPFLMQARMSYTAIGIFSFAAYPYSFKLLWSPVVDASALPGLGRRKSWIVPLQLLSAAVMLLGGAHAQARLDAGDALGVTLAFFALVLLAATQDVAVDGWALELLSPRNVGWASTCQTVGMNVGYFLSFTVFLALSDPDFCNARLRAPDKASDGGIVTLAGYLRFWGWAYLVLTLAIAALKKEGGRPRPAPAVDDEIFGEGAALCLNHAEPDGHAALHAVPLAAECGAAARHDVGAEHSAAAPTVSQAYWQLLRVINLPAVKRLAVVLIVCRLGMLPAEAAAALKLLEKGVSKEALAALVLLEFPMEMVSAMVAGRWAASGRPFHPWLLGYKVRLVLAALSTAAVYLFPSGAQSLTDAPVAFAAVAALGVATSFCSTLMFTAMGSFYNKISDPSMGGAYLTLLNTIANVGITVPKFFVFAAMDSLTRRVCVDGSSGRPLPGLPGDTCPASAAGHSHSAPAHAACVAAGGQCIVLRDGFYPVSALSILAGLAILLWLRADLPRLEALPQSAWRAPLGKKPRPAKDKEL
ncbi:hypothetical protein ACKKBF_B01590 [Auxenochlorella protothecoides x Auxenochlorella symbiontica]